MQYIIKDVYSIGTEKGYNILSSLCKDDESVVLYRCDTKLSELSKEAYNVSKEDYFEGYCGGYIGLMMEDHFRIKCSIVNYLRENNLLQIKHSMRMDRAIEEYKNMVENSFNMYSEEIVDQIKNIIIDIAYDSRDPDEKKYIDERTVYRNNYFIDEEGMDKLDFSNIWYKPKNREEYIYSLVIEGLFAGVILNVENPFDHLATSFCKVETAADDDLIIRLKGDEQLSEKTKSLLNEYKLQVVTI